MSFSYNSIFVLNRVFLFWPVVVDGFFILQEFFDRRAPVRHFAGATDVSRAD